MTLQRKPLTDIVTITRASTATYFNSAGVLQIASVDQPRIDYDPATLAPRGFLVEEARTNTITRSAEFDDAIWLKSASTVTANAATSPNGLMNGDALIGTAVTSEHYVEQTISVTSGTTYTFSTFVKAAGVSDFGLRFTMGALWGGSSPQMQFNLTTGASSVIAGAIVQSSIVNVGSGWWRVSMSAACTTSGASLARMHLMSGLNNSFTGDGTSGVYLWGAQLEVGDFRTSHIPTTTAAVTRARDFAVISGSVFSGFFNSTEGTIVAEGTAYNLADNRGLYAISNGTDANEYFGFVTPPNSMRHVVRTDSALQGDNLQTGVVTVGAPFKTARSYKANDLRSATNGVLSTPDTAATLPTGMDRMAIGHRGDAPTYGFPLNGHIRKVLYYPVSFTDAQLQTVTT